MEPGFHSHRSDGAPAKLIDLERLGQSPFQRKLLGYLSVPIERALCLDSLNHIYARAIKSKMRQANFFQSTLAALDINVNLAVQDLGNIPLKGASVVTANHPLGALDGIVLASVLTALRPDVKILGNYLLAQIPELEPWLIPVDPFRLERSARFNIGPLRNAISWVKEGGMLLVFPGREVSHFQLTDYSISDSAWSPSIAAIIQHARATVVPAYFTDTNSWIFQVLGLVHPFLRTALLPRELNSRRSSSIEIRIGKRIPWSRLSAFENSEELLNHVRRLTYVMANRDPLGAGPDLEFASRRELTVIQEPIIAPTDPLVLRSEVSNLPAQQKLVQSGQYCAFYATAEQIPHLLREIGRQREITFREADEGTGRSIDLDHFDDHYTHLFLWHTSENELVGAYRLGLVPDILKRFGADGLYTNLLFRYEPELWSRWDQAIELGRAFIRPKYQKQMPPLSLLWKGICQFIVGHPQFKTLFGPLSISRAYHQASKSLIELYIRERMFDKELSGLVKARNPFRPSPLAGARAKSLRGAMRDLDDVSAFVASIEPDGKGVPVLFRQYAKFDFRVLGFNVNRYFSSTVDGLMYVDLARVKAKVLRRYMGEPGYASYAAYHGLGLS